MKTTSWIKRNRHPHFRECLFLFGNQNISIVRNIQIFVDGEVDGGGHLRVVVGVVPYRDASAAGLLADQREVIAVAVEGVVAAEVDKTVAALIAPVVALCGLAVLGEVERAACTVPACAAVVGACVGGLYGAAVIAAVIINAVAVIAPAVVVVFIEVVVLIAVVGIAVGVGALVIGGHVVLSIIGVGCIRSLIVCLCCGVPDLSGFLRALRVLCRDGGLYRLRFVGCLVIVQHRNTEYGAAREKRDRAYRCRDDGDVFLSLYALSVRSHCVDSCVDSVFLIDSLAVHWYDLLYVLISVGFVPLTVTIVYQTDYDKIGTKIGFLQQI